jgi:hypothetical protein
MARIEGRSSAVGSAAYGRMDRALIGVCIHSAGGQRNVSLSIRSARRTQALIFPSDGPFQTKASLIAVTVANGAHAHDLITGTAVITSLVADFVVRLEWLGSRVAPSGTGRTGELEPLCIIYTWTLHSPVLIGEIDCASRPAAARRGPVFRYRTTSQKYRAQEGK